MSELTIPGVTSKYNTDKMIEKLMKLERIPLTRLENTKKTFTEKKEVWRDLNNLMGKFKDTARNLYGFQNPFKEHIAKSSNENIITATASRQAENESFEITVDQLAGRDRFLSSPVSNDFKVKEGTYGFQVGDKKVSFHYSGGRISDFISVLNRRSNGLIKGKLLKDSDSTQVFLLESTKTGSKNKLSFSEDSIDLGIKTGLIKQVNSSTRKITLTEGNILTDKNSEVSVVKDNLTVEPMGTATIPVNPPVKLTSGMVLDYDVKILELPKKEYTPPSPPPGPELTPPGSVTFEGVTIEDSKSQVVVPPWNPPPAPEHRETLNVLYANGSQSLPELKPTEEVQHFSIPASRLGGTLNSITIKNDNTSRKIIISNIKVYNPSERDGIAPANPIEEAKDAVITLEGVKIKRQSNKIDDLIDGVTLELHNTGREKVKLQIEPDRKLIKDSIINFVGNYNQLLKEIQILTSNDPAVISELDYLTDDEKEKAKKRLGMFQGDITFSQMKNRLQQIAMASYPTSMGRNLNLLAQIGISTNSSGFGGSIDRTKLRGYLEIDENKLDDALKTEIPAIKELFGNDTNEDLLVDSGVAYAMDQYLNVYTKVGGVISSRISSIDGRISRLDDDIVAMKSNLEAKEQQLKIKYGKMEGALENLQESSKAIDNFSKNNNN